jgi:hypothetical protein
MRARSHWGKRLRLTLWPQDSTGTRCLRRFVSAPTIAAVVVVAAFSFFSFFFFCYYLCMFFVLIVIVTLLPYLPVLRLRCARTSQLGCAMV